MLWWFYLWGGLQSCSQDQDKQEEEEVVEEDGGGSGWSVGAGEECLQAERTAHPVRAGRGHWLPAGLLSQRQAALGAGQLYDMPGGDWAPWSPLTLPTCLPALSQPLQCPCVTPCLFLKCLDGFNSYYKRLHLIPCSLHPPYQNSMCYIFTVTHTHTHKHVLLSFWGQCIDSHSVRGGFTKTATCLTPTFNLDMTW